MAISQVVPIYLTLKGDGSSTVFTFALANLYQQGFGGSVPFGTAGVVPSSIAINNPPVAVTSATVDANGNITITLTTALGSGVTQTFELDLVYNSGAATSSSATQTQNVALTDFDGCGHRNFLSGHTASFMVRSNRCRNTGHSS